MRIPSGVTDQYVYFVAVDSEDFTTRETGFVFGGFTVYYSRNGGAATQMTITSGDITEVDATNMAGVYKLLLDTDMTIDAGDDEQEMVFHITHAGMAPVSRAITLYRPKATVGNTLDVTATGAAGIDWANIEGKTTTHDFTNTTINTVTTNTDLVSAADVWAAATRTLSAATNITSDASALNVTSGTLDLVTDVTTKTGFSLSAAGVTAVWAETGLDIVGVPNITASMADKVDWLFALSRNAFTQTATVGTITNTSTAAIATTAVSDAAGTFTRAEWTDVP